MPRASQNAAQVPLRSEEINAQLTAARGRTVALILIALLVSSQSPWPGPVYLYPLLALFIVLGWAAYAVARAPYGRVWHQYALVLADFALLTFTLLAPNPLIPVDYPPQFVLQFDTFIYYFVLLAGLAYVYKPRLVIWGGICGGLTWSIGILWLASLPGSVWDEGNGTLQEAIANRANPRFIDMGVRIQEVVVLLIVAGLLAMAVSRARQVAVRQAGLAQERANLARYFPQKTADLLAQRTDPFERPQEHEAAVLFADLVKFTTWAEHKSPPETIALLRDVHAVLAEVVFEHGGTLDKFIGDGLMATFGTPEPQADDATRALAAMMDMADRFDHWRAASGNTEMRLAIGLHYGPVVVGNIGSADRLEFAVLGDTVNLASRLEAATRQHHCRCLVSEAVINATGMPTPPGLEAVGPIPVKGREDPIAVYRLV